MDNLTDYQQRILDKLYGALEKKDPNIELIRLSKLYRGHREYQEPGYIKEQFQVVINSQLQSYLQSKPKFYNFDSFKAHYRMLAGDFIEDNIDANEKDFIVKYINSQQEIIDKTFRHFIPIEGEEALELTQFVDKDFFDDFIRSSKKKIEFLNSLSINQESAPEINYDNPYPLLFISGDIYSKFKEYTSLHIIDVISDYSYLFKTLKSLRLIHNCTEKEFMLMVYEEMELISKKTYDKFMVIGRLKSLKNSSSESRLNNFNNIFLD